jgi:hypothetical protein
LLEEKTRAEANGTGFTTNAFNEVNHYPFDIMRGEKFTSGGKYVAMALLAILVLAAGNASAVTTHTEMPFFVKELPDSVGGGFEPHLTVGPGTDGNEWIYIDSPCGVRSTKGGNLWISKDGGEAWVLYAKLPAGQNPGASGDTHTAISSNGIIYFTDLYLATATVDTSKDGGMTWVQNPAASVYPVDDRQWLAMGPTIGGLLGATPETLYFMFNQLAIGLCMVKSQVTEDAIVWIPCNGGAPITQNVASRDYFAVDQKDGTIYCPNAGDGMVYVSSDGGESFTSYPLEGMSQNIFVSADVDIAGNVYTAWTDQSDIYLAVSIDKAKTWKTFQVTDTIGTRVLPWVTAGDAGMIGLTWYETPEEGNSDGLGDAAWDLMAAVCVDALSESPNLKIATVQKEVHKGTVSTGGLDLLGTGADRDLGDFFTCDVDKGGRLVMTYGNDWKDEGVSNSRLSAVMFAKQLSEPFLRSSGITPDFTYAPSSPAAGSTIQFNDNSTIANGTIAAWLWEFGDGKNSTEQNPTHKYDNAGEYLVTLEITSGANRTGIASRQIAVNSGAEKPTGIPGFEIFAFAASIALASLAIGKKR